MKNLVLDGSARNTHPLRLCDRCETKKPPEGGVQLGQNRWYCAGCWIRKSNKPPRWKK